METPHLDDIGRSLEQLALKVVMLAEDDLPALGAFLVELEGLQARVGDCRALEAAQALEGMIRVGNSLALQEVEAAAQALNLLGQGIALLQRWAREGRWPHSDEAARTLGRLAGEMGEAPGVAPPAAEVQAALDDPELASGFLAEAREHLEGIETRLVHLERHPEDLEAVNAIFRPFHTIKGVAGFLNLAQIQEAGHEVESLLDRVRSGNLPVTPDLVDVVLAGVDLLKDMLADLEEALAASRPLAAFDLSRLKEGIRALCQADPPAPRLGEILLDEGELKPDELAISLKAQELEPARRPLGEILVEAGQVAPQKVARALVKQMSEAKGAADLAAPPTIKVDLAKVDVLVDLMGELVILQSQVKQNPRLLRAADPKLNRDLGQMGRITTDLQKISMSLRMVPISATFRKMMRLVRDLSHKVKKQVDLRLEGEETEIDRNMVEALYDPLVHLVRNAVDHGLEAPAARQAGGKPPEGRLTLRAYHKGGSIVIEIEDDGQGLDREAVLAKARQRGLAAAGEALTPGQIDNLIFEAGFSTAREVTEVSGRGVGLDVVRQTVEALRGKVDLASRPGEGSCFTLRLPLTLALIDGLILRVGQERYILPAHGVRETLRPLPADCFTVAGKRELIQVRGTLLPLLRLHRLFGVGDPDLAPAEAQVLVVEHEGQSRALLVDEILDKQEVVIKSLGPVFQRLPGLAGGTILGDGRVGLILDLAGLLRLEEEGLAPDSLGSRNSGSMTAST